MQPQGLENLGNTCYLNSGLQAIVAIPTLRALVLNDEIYKQLKENFLNSKKNRTKCVLYFWIVARDMIEGRDVHDCNDFTVFIESVWIMYPHLSDYTQQDSVEFIQLLLDMIHEELKQEIVTQNSEAVEDALEEEKKESTSPSTLCTVTTSLEPALSYLQPIDGNLVPQKYTSPISEQFGGFLQSEIKCSACGSVSICKDAFFDLSLSIPEEEMKPIWYSGAMNIFLSVLSNIPIINRFMSSPSYSLQSLLPLYFGEQKLQDGMDCEKCKCVQEGSKMFKILRLPKVLCFHIKRFHHTRHSLLLFSYTLLHKRTNHINFPLTLNLTTRYHLRSVVNHHGGSLGGGHYTSFVRSSADQWYLCDDSYVTKVSTNQVLASEAYLLFYERE